jgi:hypothetical protein
MIMGVGSLVAAIALIFLKLSATQGGTSPA